MDVATGAPEKQAKRHSLYPARFTLAYGALGLAVAAAAVGLALSVTHIGGIGKQTAWSPWQPQKGSPIGVAQQVAKHVGAEYKLGNLVQLVDVIAKPPAVTSNGQKIPVGYVAVRGLHGHGDSVATTTPSNSVLYTLCGLGTNCSIASGTPSVARGRLVRREILELALYTFRYDSGIDNVIAIMPPRDGKTAPAVIFLQRADLAVELSHRLAWTLDPQTPKVNTMTPGDKLYVDKLTLHRAYSFSLTRAQDGNAILILTHLKA